MKTNNHTKDDPMKTTKSYQRSTQPKNNLKCFTKDLNKGPPKKKYKVFSEKVQQRKNQL
jgi:hypothetical protein